MCRQISARVTVRRLWAKTIRHTCPGEYHRRFLSTVRIRRRRNYQINAIGRHLAQDGETITLNNAILPFGRKASSCGHYFTHAGFWLLLATSSWRKAAEPQAEGK